MRIIFESKEERDDFLKLIYTAGYPLKIGLPTTNCSCTTTCESGWRDAIPHEIKEAK